MIIDSFPNRPIYKIKYPQFEEISKMLTPAIEKYISPDYNFFDKMKGVCCLVKHNKYPLKTQLSSSVPWLDYLQNLNKFVEDTSINYCQVASNDFRKLKIEAIWFSYYPNNTYFEYHTHTNVAAVAVFYLKKPNNSGNMWIKENENDIQEYEIIGEEGDLMIFPGFLPHKTTDNLSHESRIAITFDLMN